MAIFMDMIISLFLLWLLSIPGQLPATHVRAVVNSRSHPSATSGGFQHFQSSFIPRPNTTNKRISSNNNNNALPGIIYNAAAEAEIEWLL